MDECRTLRQWALNNPAPRPEPAADTQILKHLRYLHSVLASRSVDDNSGDHRFAVYLSVLRKYPNDALAFMARTACESLKWFPVPSECLEILGRYKPPETDQENALRLCGTFMQDAFERWLANLQDGNPIGDVPERWINIAVERGALRRLALGIIVSVALYQGPFKRAT